MVGCFSFGTPWKINFFEPQNEGEVCLDDDDDFPFHLDGCFGFQGWNISFFFQTLSTKNSIDILSDVLIETWG